MSPEEVVKDHLQAAHPGHAGLCTHRHHRVDEQEAQNHRDKSHKLFNQWTEMGPMSTCSLHSPLSHCSNTSDSTLLCLTLHCWLCPGTDTDTALTTFMVEGHWLAQSCSSHSLVNMCTNTASFSDVKNLITTCGGEKHCALLGFYILQTCCPQSGTRHKNSLGVLDK